LNIDIETVNEMIKELNKQDSHINKAFKAIFNSTYIGVDSLDDVLDNGFTENMAAATECGDFLHTCLTLIKEQYEQRST